MYNDLKKIFLEILLNVMSNFTQNQSFKNKNLKIYYWREGNDEVDFVVEYKKRVIAIEVKTGKVGGLSGMNAFHKIHKPEKSLVIGTGGLAWEEILQMEVTDLYD